MLYFWYIIINIENIQKKGEKAMAYNFREVEAKWQNKWYSEGTFNASQDFTNKKK